MDLNKYNFSKNEIKDLENILTKTNLSKLLKKKSKSLNINSKNDIKYFCRSTPSFKNLSKSSLKFMENNNNINYCSKIAIKYHNKRVK